MGGGGLFAGGYGGMPPQHARAAHATFEGGGPGGGGEGGGGGGEAGAAGGEGDDAKHNKYCHFCQHVKVGATLYARDPVTLRPNPSPWTVYPRTLQSYTPQPFPSPKMK